MTILPFPDWVKPNAMSRAFRSRIDEFTSSEGSQGTLTNKTGMSSLRLPLD